MKILLPAIRISLIAFFMSLFFGYQPANAGVLEARSYIYFDSADNIIGQNIIDCRNNAAYAGNVDDSNPYYYVQVWNCGAQYIVCNTGSPPSCSGVPTGAAYTEHFHSATGRGLIDYCNASTVYVPGLPFSGHPDCEGSTGQNIGVILFLPFTRGYPPVSLDDKQLGF